MSFSIAVAGKGGVGKTTMSSLMIRHILKAGAGPVLAVDADPNSNLAESFAIEPDQTIGRVLHEFMLNRMKIPPGMTKESYLELKIGTSIIESKGVDFIVLGRKHGDGCYCFPNSLLKNFIQKTSGSYPYMMVDNEAGMEHLSRKNLEKVDLFVLVSDHSVKGLRAARRVNELAGELNIVIEKKTLIVNRFREENRELLEQTIAEVGVESVYTIGDDPQIVHADAARMSVMDLPDDTPAVSAVNALMTELIGDLAAKA